MMEFTHSVKLFFFVDTEGKKYEPKMQSIKNNVNVSVKLIEEVKCEVPRVEEYVIKWNYCILALQARNYKTEYKIYIPEGTKQIVD